MKEKILMRLVEIHQDREKKNKFTVPNEERMIKQPLILLKVTKKVMAPRFPGSCPTNQERVMRSCGSFDT